MINALAILSRLPRRKLYFGMPLRVFVRERDIWYGMRARCADLKNPWYGALGVTVCVRWCKSFENFLMDMGPRPSIKHSIDRYPDPAGNYEPTNCRWATCIEQARNKRPRVAKQ